MPGREEGAGMGVGGGGGNRAAGTGFNRPC